ncbi:MAG: DUF420 domain-containing protein [Planctomycetes bacterium]|nr:DUF420 domain-containing protein [Planctomycetota bacterium]
MTLAVDGFLGTRASFMLDVVFLAMFAVVPIMFWNVWLVRSRKNYRLHKRVQLLLGAVLLLAVTLFEVDMRVNGWKHRAVDSSYPGLVMPSLYIHLCFAVPTAVVWSWVIFRAVRRFAHDPVPNMHSVEHRRWGWIGVFLMTMTALTGWAFYAFAFI